MTTDTQQSTTPFRYALLTVPGLPQEAVDAIWRSGAVAGWSLGDTPLLPPSDQYTAELLTAPSETPELVALAASLTNPQILSGLVRTHQHEAVWSAAAANLSLAPATSDTMSASPLGVRTVAARKAARQALTEAEKAQNTAMVESLAQMIIEAGEAVLAAELIEDHLAASATGVRNGVAVAILAELIAVEWGPKAHHIRVFRDRVLQICDTATRADLAGRIARTTEAPVTAVALEAIADLVGSAKLMPAEITARLDAEAAAYADLVGGFANDVLAAQLAKAAKPVRKAAPARKAPDLGKHDSTADEAALLTALGLGSVAARSTLNSAEPATPAQLATALDTADAETVIDWAEGRMPKRPEPGEVTREMTRMAYRRLRELAAEVARRPDPLENCPDLVMIAPKVAERAVGNKAARSAAVLITKRLGRDSDAWQVFAKLVNDAPEETLLELADAAGNIVTV
jgi:hypothetical protein